MTSSPTGANNRRRVLGISGSLRKASFNSGMLRAAQELAPDGIDIVIHDIRNLPFYDGDLEADGDPAPVSALKSAIRDADGVLFATPEYNWGTSGVLKNAIDWASRDRDEGSLMSKPATIMGAGGRAGTARAQMQLHEVLSETGAVLMVKPGVLVQAFGPMRFNEDGDLTDEDTRQVLRQHLQEFARWIHLVGARGYARQACEVDIELARV